MRDLTWSRHQLEELAQRRFLAAQLEAQRRHTGLGSGSPSPSGDGGRQLYDFSDLFKAVKMEDFSSYLSKLSTPRELLLFMTELLSRIEAHPDSNLSAQVRTQGGGGGLLCAEQRGGLAACPGGGAAKAGGASSP